MSTIQHGSCVAGVEEEEQEYVDLMPRYAFRSWKCNKNYITLNSHIFWARAEGDGVVVIFRCECKWLKGWGDKEKGTTWCGSGFQQATINCNSKSLKLQQITGGKLTAKRLRCRRRRWLSSREMSTCGSRQRRQALPAGALWVPGMAPWTEVVLARAPFVVIFSANLLFSHFGHWLYIYIYLCVCPLLLPLCNNNSNRWRWHYLLLLLLSDKTWHLLQGDEASETSWLEPRDKFLWNTFLIYLHQELCVPIVALSGRSA